MKIRYLIILLATLSLKTQAQVHYLDSIFEPGLCGELFEQPAGYLGNPYFNKDWVPGDIILNTGDTAFNKLLRYNGYLDELFWLSDLKSQPVKLDKPFISEFYLHLPDGRKGRFKSMMVSNSLPGDSVERFIEILHEGDFSLYVYRNVIVRGTTTRRSEGKDLQLNILEPQPVYFIVFPDKQTVSFYHIKRRSILRIIPDLYKPMVKGILKEHHLPLRNETQLDELVSLIK